MNSYMDTLEKAGLTASICHIARFLKLGIPICNSAVPDTLAEKEEEEEEQGQLFCRFRMTFGESRGTLIFIACL